MLISGASDNIQSQSFQVDFNYSQTSQYQLTTNGEQQIGSFSSAVTISLSISAINVTTGFLAAEQIIDDSGDDEHPRAEGIVKALKELFTELEENDGLTGKVAKRLFKLVSSLNAARGTDTKLGELDKDTRDEVRSARQQVNDFFRAKHSTVFINDDLENFITLIAKLETLREFALKTTDLLTALKGENDDVDESQSEEDSRPLINIKA
ncbi:MAG: hypothetical protein COB49_10655 [Alphaproteobacteria bacterium]|nr:MAG: hypothetical protein COB49_10655 [Alphaproteobacteria bacterium]